MKIHFDRNTLSGYKQEMESGWKQKIMSFQNESKVIKWYV